MSEQLTIEILTQRLERVERENRWWRGGLSMLVLLLVSAVLLMGQAPSKGGVIEAESFVVKDGDGKVRAILGKEVGGLRALAPGWGSLSEGSASYGLHLYGPDGRYLAGLAQSPPFAGGGALVLVDRHTASRADLSVAGGYVDLVLSATKQTHEAAQRESNEYGQKFNAAKAKGEEPPPRPKHTGTLVRLLVTEAPSLQFEEKGTTRAVLGSTALEARRTGVVEQRPLSSLVLFDKDGHVIWKAP